MQMSIGLDRLKRFVCLLLIFVLLFCFFMCPRASAVALEATTIAYGGLLVGTILVGAGVVFSSHGDMVKVGNAMYKTLVNGSSAIGKTISSISAWAVEHGTSLAKGALRVGKDLYQGIVDAFNSSYVDGLYSSDGLQTFVVNSDNFDVFAKQIDGLKVQSFLGRCDSTASPGNFSLHIEASGKYYSAVGTYKGMPYSCTFDGMYANAPVATMTFSHFVFEASSGHFQPYAYFVQNNGGWITFDCKGFWIFTPFTFGSAIPLQGDDLAYPSDNYLVRMPDIPSVDTATGDVTYPNDTAYTKDAVAVPYPVDTEGVKVPDIPFDKVVDKSTGKTMDGTDTGTDTDNPSKPGEGTDTDKPSVNWPSAGDISLPKLIISKFPFCIPFDVARLIGLLEADPKTPIFHVPLKVGTILDEEIVLDLSQWDNAVRIIRWGELIVFVAGLVLVTRNYIKW